MRISDWSSDVCSSDLAMPLIRTMLAFNAYSEGWALYAEQLADELGLSDDFEVGRLGYLQSLAFSACRLDVDTGLHATRWTREQAVELFAKENGSNTLEVASEEIGRAHVGTPVTNPSLV